MSETHLTKDSDLRAVLALMDCVHCGWPKGDPNGCRFFCVTEHDYTEHEEVATRAACHTQGGMCDGDGSTCHCIRIRSSIEDELAAQQPPEVREPER